MRWLWLILACAFIGFVVGATAGCTGQRDALLQPSTPTPAERHKTRVRNLLNRLIWNESEGDAEEFEILGDDLDARLHEAAQGYGFADTPFELIAQRVAADMGLSGELVLTLPAVRTAVAAAPPEPALEPACADTG